MSYIPDNRNQNGEDKSKALQCLVVSRATLNDPVLQAEDDQLWVSHEKEGFVAGSVIGENGNYFLVKLNNFNQEINVHKNLCSKQNPSKFDDVENMTDLLYLNDGSVLNIIKLRYQSQKTYSRIGSLLIAMNAFIQSKLDTEIIKYKEEKCRAHIFAIADTAYRSMLLEREDQSILCTGESGAGKTENTKKLLYYLVTSHKQAGLRHQGDLKHRLLQANPIIEAFGNSKTVKNDNSSRFGRFIRINFNKDGHICSANIKYLLLEKSRVYHQPKNERNFNFFYQFVHGTTSEEKKKYQIERFSNYKLMKTNNIILTVHDRAAYLNTIKSMKIMGFHSDEITSVLRVVHAILLLGNIEWYQKRGGDQAFILNYGVVVKICHLLSIPTSDFTNAIQFPEINYRGKLVRITQTIEQAQYAVEAICKEFYERMFRWLVKRINKSLDLTCHQETSFIGILDIAGFEIFGLNSFERLCLNYTNEKLQQFFNIMYEQEEYKREGIDWQFINLGLNLEPTIDLIETGIFDRLDTECLSLNATDKSFVEELLVNHERHLKLIAPETCDKYDFRIVHYAGQVDYVANQFLTKNMDPLNENVVNVMKFSEDPFVVKIWKDVEFVDAVDVPFGARQQSTSLRTTSRIHRSQLIRLMKTLHNTAPHFVRCIIPNHEKIPGKVNSLLVLEQLRCNGVLEGIRICRQGFPSKVPFQEFRHRYELLTPETKNIMDDKTAVEKMVKILNMDGDSFRIGQSKIFFRVGVLAQLNSDLSIKIENNDKEKDNQLRYLTAQLEEQKTSTEHRTEELRSKFQRQIEEIREEAEQSKRQKMQIEKELNQLKQEMEKITSERDALQIAKNEVDKRRKYAENQLSESSARFNELEITKNNQQNYDKEQDNPDTVSLMEKIENLKNQIKELENTVAKKRIQKNYN